MSETLHKSTKARNPELTREAVIVGVMSGKTEQQIADELGVDRTWVAKIKAKPEVRKRIQERIADRYSLTDNEVIGTLAAQMRADVTDLFDKDGGFSIPALRRKRLGFLVKKIKVRRVVEGRDEDATPVDIIEIELHSQQQAAISLAKILGIEQEPAPNTQRLEAAVQDFITRTGKTRIEAIEFLKPHIPQISELVH